ncbi:rhamnogalacturonate lyase [Quercus suber]|uniref:Rhamnogalacturonate lyase n=1 Tax=Quercus suber TaxID=58331 RepID=A0AAW0M4R8_QUESU
MSQGVQLHIEKSHVVMDNGILKVKLSKPGGIVTGIKYNGIDNLLEVLNEEVNRGYNMALQLFSLFSTVYESKKFKVLDLVWSKAGSTGTTGTSDVIKGTSFEVIVESEKQVEISFTRLWDPSLQGKSVPLNIDKRFHYMAMADNRQRYMPLPDDRLPGRGEPLATPEAVLLVNPVEPEFKGEVDDKYQYSCENKDLRVHGWICMDPPVGFWQITPSSEFRSGEDLVLKLSPDEPWKKVFGPIFMYLNSVTDGDDPLHLWEDAKNQMMIEVESWPYDFPASEDFPTADQRGSVSGRLQIQDRFLSDEYISANSAYVGLAPPGDVGSWQRECKGYQFWTTADADGYFSIKNIRSGSYNLYAWVPGPPRDGPTLWEIGTPDRTAAEFYIPDPDPKYINKLYVNHPDRYRQYGLWERYADLYPDEDLVYTVGVSDYTKDWFFAQVTRKLSDDTYQGTTWQIKFKLDLVDTNGSYTLRLALATAQISELQVRVNDPKTSSPLFSTGVIGHDNTIARHGIHGLYRLYNVEVPLTQLVDGHNTIFLTQTMASGEFPALQGIMYDYIRFEGPSSSNSKKKTN